MIFKWTVVHSAGSWSIRRRTSPIRRTSSPIRRPNIAHSAEYRPFGGQNGPFGGHRPFGEKWNPSRPKCVFMHRPFGETWTFIARGPLLPTTLGFRFPIYAEQQPEPWSNSRKAPEQYRKCPRALSKTPQSNIPKAPEKYPTPPRAISTARPSNIQILGEYGGRWLQMQKSLRN